jgi:hypothetical protein
MRVFLFQDIVPLIYIFGIKVKDSRVSKFIQKHEIALKIFKLQFTGVLSISTRKGEEIFAWMFFSLKRANLLLNSWRRFEMLSTYLSGFYTSLMGAGLAQAV